LFKPWSPGVGRGQPTIWKTIFTCVCIEKNLLLQNQQANFNQTWYKSFLGKGYSKLFKLRASRHFYETFLRFILRYVLRYNLGKRLGTPKYGNVL
jgi:hypothetical protein